MSEETKKSFFTPVTSVLSVIATGIFAFAVGVGYNAATDDEPKVTKNPVTTTTEAPVGPSRAECVEMMDTVQEGLDAIASGVDFLPYVTDAEVLDFLATSKEFVRTAKTSVSLCEHYAPADGRAFYNSLDDLEDTITSAETAYRTS